MYDRFEGYGTVLAASREEAILKSAFQAGLLNAETTTVGIMDLEGFHRGIVALQQAFPDNFQHFFAVKSNSLVAVLKEALAAGAGLEVSSPGELALALAAGAVGEQLSYNSPAKTANDLRACLSQGIALNLDNAQELERLCALIHEFPEINSPIGFRINTQVGAGSVASTSTATATSKFGYALEDAGNREQIIQHYLDHPWLNAIHTHTGSKGIPLGLMIEGVAKVADLAETINERAGTQRVRVINIGGGLPIHHDPSVENPSFADYSEALSREVPALFTGRYRVETEFGRALAARHGLLVTRVEYTKNAGGRHIVLTHAGAQIAARTALAPAAWPLYLSAYGADGTRKNTPKVQTDIAGPCCFAGDLMAKDIALEQLEQNDFVVVSHAGAYGFTIHYDFNSLPKIQVLGARGTGKQLELTEIRAQQSIADIVRAMQ